jgi:putative ABC transport system permease protein
MLSFYKEGTKTRITIYGIEKNSQLIILRDNKGNRVDLEGFVISQALADKLNLKEGDILNVINNIDGKKYSLKVSKIVDLFVGNTGYMNLEEFNKTFGLEEGAFIGLYSIDRLNIPKEELIVSMSKSDLIKAFEDSTESVNQMLQMMYIVSFFMAFIIIYVLSSLIITENRKTLSIFKILGYRDGELGTMFLGFNNISFLLGFLIGIPLYSSFIKYIINVALRDVDFSLKMYAGFKDIAITFIILLIAFLLSKYLGRRKIRKILPGVILKEQTE